MIRQYSYAAAGQVSQAAIGLVGLALVTRILGPSDYGSYVVLGTLLTLLTVAMSAGPSAAVLILAARDPDQRARLHGQVVLSALVLFIVVVAVTPAMCVPVAALVSPRLAPILAGVSLIRLPLLVYASLVSSQLSGAGSVGLAAALNTVAAALSLLGVFGAVIAHDALAGAIIGTAIAAVLTAAMMAVAATRSMGFGRPRGWEPWRSAAAIAVPMHLGTLAYWVMLRADALAVNALQGTRSAGVYGVALLLSERVGLLTAPVYNATAWRISGSDRTAGLRATLLVVRLELVVGIAATIGALLFGRLAITVVSGEAYADAALPLAVLVLGAATLPIWSALGLFLVSHHRGAWRTTAVQVVVALLAVGGYWTIGSRLGVVGPALVSTGAYLLLVAAGIVMVRGHERLGLGDLIPTVSDVRTGAATVRHLLKRVRDSASDG